MIPKTNLTVENKIRSMEDELAMLQKQKATLEKEKEFKYPSKWSRKFKASNRKAQIGKVPVIYLNKKGEMEVPVYLPVFDGNMIIYKNKPYEFDPRSMWKVKGFKGNPMAVLIKETDRKPVRNKNGKVVYMDGEVTNQDIEEIRKRGDSTEHDEFLLKFLLRASQSTAQKKVNIGIMIILGIVVIGGLIWLLSSK